MRGELRLVIATMCLGMIGHAGPAGAAGSHGSHGSQGSHGSHGSPGNASASETAAARGDAWTVAGRCDEAVTAYELAIKLDPRPLWKIRLATCLDRVGRAAEAEQLLTELVKLPPPVGPSALATRADLLMRKHEVAAAVAVYEELVKLQPTVETWQALLEALLVKADSAGHAGDDAARKRGLEVTAILLKHPRADQSCRRRAEEVAALLTYGAVARDMLDAKARLVAGDAKSAVPVLERVATAQPGLEEASYLLGLALVAPEVARRGDARKAWQRAPHVKEAQLQLGLDAYEGGELDEAERRLRAATELDGRYQDAQYQLGLVLREAGRADDAKAAFRKAVLIDSRSDLGKWAATKLSLLTGNVSAMSEGQIVDTSSEIGLGQEIVRQLSSTVGRMDDPALETRLQGILKKLAQVSDRPERELRWQVVLVDVKMVNALTLPGGTVLVFRGLVELVRDQLGDRDDAWAAVLGHECAHAALRHGMGMIQVASSLAGGKALIGQGELAGLLNTVSRAHEFEADQFGSLYAYRAGFNPAVMLELQAAMLAHNGEIPRGMTHPTHKERIERVQDYLLDVRGKVRGFDLAIKALDAGDFDLATQRLEVFLGVFPDSTAARSNLGVALHKKALRALAPASRFRRVTDVDPSSRVRKIELRAGAEAPKVDERLLRAAVVEYESALTLDPGYGRALTNLGAALSDLHDRTRARAVLERAVKAAPGSKEAWNNLGTVAAEQGQAARAAEALHRSLELDAQFPDAWFNLALVEEQAGRPKEAVAAWDRYLQLDGKSGWADAAKAARGRLAK